MPKSDIKAAAILLNLGSPDSTEVADVRRYLDEFLSDERVLDIAAWKRKLILKLFILPTRPKESAEAYGEVWTDEGISLSLSQVRNSTNLFLTKWTCPYFSVCVMATPQPMMSSSRSRRKASPIFSSCLSILIMQCRAMRQRSSKRWKKSTSNAQRCAPSCCNHSTKMMITSKL